MPLSRPTALRSTTAPSIRPLRAPRSTATLRPLHTILTGLEKETPLLCRAVKSAEAGEQLDDATMQLISDLSAEAESHVKGVTQQHDSEATGSPGVTLESTDLRNKVMKSILDLQSGLLERETEVRLLLLAALCGEHLLLLGPPGTFPSL